MRVFRSVPRCQFQLCPRGHSVWNTGQWLVSSLSRAFGVLNWYVDSVTFFAGRSVRPKQFLRIRTHCVTASIKEVAMPASVVCSVSQIFTVRLQQHSNKSPAYGSVQVARDVNSRLIFCAFSALKAIEIAQFRQGE